jgi:hypothetical protein
VAEFTGAVWGLEERASPLEPLGGKRCLQAVFASCAWENLFKHLAADADNEYAMIDSTIVRAHQHSAGAQKKTVQTQPSGAAKAARLSPIR